MTAKFMFSADHCFAQCSCFWCIWVSVQRNQYTGLRSILPAFLTPSTGLLGGRTFLLVLKKLHFWYLHFFGDFDLFFVWIHCLIIGSLQLVTKYMLFDN